MLINPFSAYSDKQLDCLGKEIQFLELARGAAVFIYVPRNNNNHSHHVTILDERNKYWMAEHEDICLADWVPENLSKVKSHYALILLSLYLGFSVSVTTSMS